MNTGQVATGFIRGTDAAINVLIGWVPDFVQIINLTDGTKIHMNAILTVVAFTSGGTDEIKAGDKLHDNVTDATAIIRQVIVDSGTWAGGNAAGWFILDPTTQVGLFAAASTAYREDVDADGDDKVTLTAVQDQDGLDIDDAVAPTTTAATNCKAYKGSRGGDAKGFTIGATISTNAKLLYYIAFRGDLPFDQTEAP